MLQLRGDVNMDYRGFKIYSVEDDRTIEEGAAVTVVTPKGEEWDFNSKVEATGYIDRHLDVDEDDHAEYVRDNRRRYSEFV